MNDQSGSVMISDSKCRIVLAKLPWHATMSSPVLGRGGWLCSLWYSMSPLPPGNVISRLQMAIA